MYLVPMQPNLPPEKVTFWAKMRAFFAFFGAHEALFFIGFGLFFAGIFGVLGAFWALTIGGGVLMLVALASGMQSGGGKP